MELSEILDRIMPLPAASKARVAAIAEDVSIAAHVPFVEAGKVDRYIYFVRRGLVRAYFMADGREITFWIGEEGSIALSMESYVRGRRGYETIETLEDCEFYRVESAKLAGLFDDDIHIANWGRKFAEHEVLRAESNLIPQLFTTGTERYEDFLKRNPGLLNRIPLEHLASYLGVTPVSLSRIRSHLAGRHKPTKE